MTNTEYHDLVIYIDQLNNKMHYPVRIVLDDEYHFDTTHLCERAVNNILLKNGSLSGADFLDTLMLCTETKMHWAEARGKYPNRRIRLSIAPEAVKLHAIQWESLAESSQVGDGIGVQIAANSNTPMSRFVSDHHAFPTPITTRPIKMLVAVAAPDDLEAWKLCPIDIEQEKQNLQEVLEDTDIQVHWLEGPCTLDRLEGELRQGYHILHFIGHGTYNKSKTDVALLLADDENQTELVFSKEFTDMIERISTGVDTTRADQLRLIFLSSCQTGISIPSKPRVGLAQKLVNDCNIPAVVAMQDLIDIRTARQFSSVFYECLLEHGTVDLACNQARAASFTDKAFDAHVPALYMRLKDGQLFKPEPVRLVLEKMLRDHDFSFYSQESQEYLRIPIHVMYHSQYQKIADPNELIYESTATVEITEALDQIWDDASHRTEPLVIGLLGEYGSNKSTQLKRMVWDTTVQSLRGPSSKIILPVYVDMIQYPNMFNGGQNQLRTLIYHSLQKYWPELTYHELDALIREDEVILRFFFDNGEYLNREIVYNAYQHIYQMVQAYPHNQFVFTADFSCFLGEHISPDITLHLLTIMPLTRRRIRYFLLNDIEGGCSGEEEKEAKKALLHKLDQNGLYHIASVPWFLVKMLTHTQSGDMPSTCAQVLLQVVNDSMISIPQELRGAAKETLCALAWEIQWNHHRALSTGDIFQIMERTRGYRQYDLEEFYNGLIESRILMALGQNHVCFSYQAVQSYFAAKALVRCPDRKKKLTTIASMLSNLNALNHWSDTMLFVCSLLASRATAYGLNNMTDEFNKDSTENDYKLIEHILNQIIHNENLLQSDQIFLAARALLECRQQGLLKQDSEPAHPTTIEPNSMGKFPGNRYTATRSLTYLVEHVNDALVWRLHSQNEPSSTHRSHIAYMLGYLVPRESIENAIRMAYEQARFDRFGEPDYDYINVRLAAIIALLRLEESEQEAILSQLDPPDVAQIFRHWRAHDVVSLTDALCNEMPKSAAAIAALALGDLYAQFSYLKEADAQEKASQAFVALSDVFLSRVSTATLWSVTYALGMADTEIVTKEVILPFIEKTENKYPPTPRWISRYKCIAHLIGLLRCQEEKVQEFLLTQCIHESKNLGLTAIAIDSLGRLSDCCYKSKLEEIALGNFEEHLPNLPLTLGANREYIQRRAVDALASIGDSDTVERLRMRPKPLQIPKHAAWYPELERAFYRTSEKIYWRLQAEANQSW